MHAQQVEKTAERREAEELIKEVIKLYRSEKYNEALPLAEKAVVLSENASGKNSDLVRRLFLTSPKYRLPRERSRMPKRHTIDISWLMRTS